MRKGHGAMLAAAMLLAAMALTQCSKANDQPPAAATAPAPEIKPIATAKELMLAIVIPSSDAVFKIAGEQPKTEDDWQKVRTNALAVAESGNLLLMPGRGPDAAEWKQMSKAMLDASLLAVKAADGKNVDALDMASNTLFETCDTCHNKYMKK